MTNSDASHLVELSGVTSEPLDRQQLEKAVRSQAAGAWVTFAGVVRDHDPDAGGEVTQLSYFAHPDATEYLRRIVAESNHVFAHPDDEVAHPVRVVATHRVGDLVVGDDALIVVVISAHRSEAFRICSEVVERIKTEVPIWKKQFTSSGNANWVGI